MFLRRSESIRVLQAAHSIDFALISHNFEQFRRFVMSNGIGCGRLLLRQIVRFAEEKQDGTDVLFEGARPAGAEAL